MHFKAGGAIFASQSLVRLNFFFLLAVYEPFTVQVLANNDRCWETTQAQQSPLAFLKDVKLTFKIAADLQHLLEVLAVWDILSWAVLSVVRF